MNFICQIELKLVCGLLRNQPSYDRANTLMRRYNADVVGIPMEPDGMDLNALKRVEKALQRLSIS